MYFPFVVTAAIWLLFDSFYSWVCRFLCSWFNLSTFHP